MNAFFRITVPCLCLSFSSVYADLERVSVSSSGQQADSFSWGSSVSADGRYIAIGSNASNLVGGDTNSVDDIFLYDRNTGITKRISVSSTGEQSNGRSTQPSISADGRIVTFTSDATNLVPGDVNALTDIFVHDSLTGITERVSISSAGEAGNDFSFHSSTSANGRYIAFSSEATNLVPGDINGLADVFVRDRLTGETELASVPSALITADGESFRASISADGRFVAYLSWLLSQRTDGVVYKSDIFVYDRQTGVTEQVSLSPDGMNGNGTSFNPAISANGQFVVFTSRANNLVEGDRNGHNDAFVHDRSTGITEQVSVTSRGDEANQLIGGVEFPSISGDGRFVLFESTGDLSAWDLNKKTDIYLHDRNTGFTELVSTSANGSVGNDESRNPWRSNTQISADGQVLAFPSFASNLITNDTNSVSDIFVRENPFLNENNTLSVSLQPTSAATPVDSYTRFRARFKNTGTQTLTNCQARIVSPLIFRGAGIYKRDFSYYTQPRYVPNPQINAAIDIAPGETGQMTLSVLPRYDYRGEVKFTYTCDNGVRALTVPFVNTIHLVGKQNPLSSEDYVQLDTNGRSQLIMNRNSTKYWHPYVVRVKNTSAQATSVNLTASSALIDRNQIRQPQFCEPVDWSNRNWICAAPRAEQLRVDLAPGELKKVRVFVHDKEAFSRKPLAHRIYVEAQDTTAETVSKTSIEAHTVN